MKTKDHISDDLQKKKQKEDHISDDHEDHILHDLQKKRKKGLHVILGAIILSQSTLGAIFASIFREFAQILQRF